MHLYLHIPFCKQACHYCDFHFSTNTTQKTRMVQAITKEILLQKEYLKNKELSSVYFGGGTPSLLNTAEIEILFKSIQSVFSIHKNAEITLEANPDDITFQRLLDWKAAGINRLSIGIQSFDENQLKFLNRAHNAEESEQCLKDALKAGFEDFSLDLIYAIPSDSNDLWKLSLNKALSFETNHLSAYCLTIEDKTVFGNRLSKQQMRPIDEELASDQFTILLEETTRNGFEQYEISNFARKQHYAKHNSSYWQGEPYLGVGPSAHSYDGQNRQWNISNNSLYLKSIEKELVPFEIETLSEKDRANELIMTGLRTMWGVDTQKINHLIDQEFKARSQQFIHDGLLLKENTILKLTNKGKLQADRIASELFFT